jgi:Alpha/beta hydrolase family
MRTVLWIGGWASTFDSMRPHLLPLAPDAMWIALDPHENASQSSHLSATFASLKDLGGSVAIVAWSLGALQVLRHLQVTGCELPFPTLLLNPIDRLVGEGAPWPERALARMRRRLGDARETVLKDFWNLMTQGAVTHAAASHPLTIPPEFAEAWHNAAMRLPVEALDAGLENLRQGLRSREDRDPIGGSLWLFGDCDDPILPFVPETWRKLWPAAKMQLGKGGHMPFLGDADLLRAVLNSIWQGQEGLEAAT